MGAGDAVFLQTILNRHSSFLTNQSTDLSSLSTWQSHSPCVQLGILLQYRQYLVAFLTDACAHCSLDHHQGPSHNPRQHPQSLSPSCLPQYHLHLPVSLLLFPFPPLNCHLRLSPSPSLARPLPQSWPSDASLSPQKLLLQPSLPGSAD